MARNKTTWPRSTKDVVLQKRRAVFRAQLKHSFGITVHDYMELYRKQGGKCGICGKEPRLRLLAVDHNHDTGEIRGLLCNRCNLGLGYFQDSPELLRKAISYLGGL